LVAQRGLDFGSARRAGRQARDPLAIFALDPLEPLGAAQLTSIAASVAAMAETRPGGALAGPWTSRLRLGNQVFTEMRRTAAPARAR